MTEIPSAPLQFYMIASYGHSPGIAERWDEAD